MNITRRPSVLALCVIAPLACARHVPAAADRASPPSVRYLFAWAGDEDRKDSDFLAVIDLARHGDRYGTIVATTPVGGRGLWPHHTEHELGPSKTLFANGFSANRNLLFDLHDPLHPKVVQRFRDADSSRPGIAFDRDSWPHGATGTAVPHGTAFGW